jgi:2-C-methyl-D-erythritol 4-phosphate cytidylyltransferase
MKNYVIIVAGGTGTRMGADKPKQFLEISQKPVLIHTICRFTEALPDIEIVIVTHSKWKKYTQNLLQEYLPDISSKIILVTGGETRFQSVKNGIKALKNAPDGYVAVHDSVRCCIKPSDIQKSFEIAVKERNCLVCTVLKESIRKINGTITHAVPRSEYLIVQTPQIFTLQDMKNVYLQHQETEANSITDDASLMENYGHTIHTFLIDDHNIKITTPQDLILAEYLLSKI